MKSILFVCLGNICRSPTAEGVFRKLVSEAGLDDQFEIESAGTGDWHVGKPADSRMQAAAAERGYQLDGTARRIEPADFERFDWIVTMDESNYANVSAMHPGSGARVVRICDFCESHDVDEVPDPYYGGEAGFYRVIDILEDACTNLLKHL